VLWTKERIGLIKIQRSNIFLGGSISILRKHFKGKHDGKRSLKVKGRWKEKLGWFLLVLSSS